MQGTEEQQGAADGSAAEEGAEERQTALGDALAAARAEAAAAESAEAAEAAEPVEPAEPEASSTEPSVDGLGRAYATGKRKNAVARVWLKRGAGHIVVNGKPGPEYFARPVLQMIINQPFQAVSRGSEFDVWCTVKGGGLSGQAGAVRHGISKALTVIEPELRPTLKKGSFLTRDSRIVERKKYGKRKARRSFQFSKR